MEYPHWMNEIQAKIIFNLAPGQGAWIPETEQDELFSMKDGQSEAKFRAESIMGRTRVQKIADA